MAYDPRAVKIKKEVKAMAALMYNKERGRHLIKEMVIVEERAARTRTARNRGDKEE